MEHFFDIFQAYNDRNNKLDKKKAEEAQKLLDPWLLINENNQRHKGRQFIIKVRQLIVLSKTLTFNSVLVFSIPLVPWVFLREY